MTRDLCLARMEGLFDASMRLIPSGPAFGCLKSLQAILSNLGPHHNFIYNKQKSPAICDDEGFVFGAHGRIRTSDHLVRSQVLYPAELHARNS